MHRFSNAVTPKSGALALASLLAAATLGLSACAERDQADSQPAASANGSAAPAPTAAQPGPASAQAPAATGTDAGAAGSLTEADRSFLAAALAANQHELQAAQLGLDKAQDEQVRAYAQRMQQDHSQLGTQMQPLVQQAGISMAEARSPMTELETASGEAFDRDFMEMMVADHRKVVADFEGAANGQGHSAQVQRTASQALPTLRNHLQEAEALARRLGVEVPAAAPDGAGAPAADGSTPPAGDDQAAAAEGGGG